MRLAGVLPSQWQIAGHEYSAAPCSQGQSQNSNHQHDEHSYVNKHTVICYMSAALAFSVLGLKIVCFLQPYDSILTSFLLKRIPTVSLFCYMSALAFSVLGLKNCLFLVTLSLQVLLKKIPT